MRSSITIFLICFSIILNPFVNLHSQWVQVSNGVGSQILSFASSGNTLYAGGNSIYKTTNNGINWIQLSVNSSYIRCVSASGNIVLAGTYYINGGVLKSTDFGATWHQTSLASFAIVDLLINGNYVFAGTLDHGIYLSTDLGESWGPSSYTSFNVYCFAVTGNNIFAGTNGSGVLLSTNNGATWSQTSLNNQLIYSISFNSNFVFAATNPYNGVYRTSNNGSNWSQTSLNNQSVFSVVTSGATIFAATGYPSPHGIYVSNDNGMTWAQRNEGMTNNIYLQSLYILNNYIFAGTDQNGVYRRPLNELIGIKQISTEVPSQFALFQNFPNPFNPTTKIRFNIPKSGNVSFKIYDITGKEVYSINEFKSAGQYEFTFDASKYASGLYFYKLESSTFSKTKKMVLIK